MKTQTAVPEVLDFPTSSINTIDIRIDKKEFEILTEDCTCIIDEVEFVKIIDLEPKMPLPVVAAPQPTTTATPRKGISKFLSSLLNRLSVLPLSLPLCLVLVLGVGNVWGQVNYVSWNFATTLSTGQQYAGSQTNMDGARSSSLSTPTITGVTNSTVTSVSATTFHRTTGWPSNTASVTSSATSYVEFTITLGSGQNFDNISLSLNTTLGTSNTSSGPNRTQIIYGWGTSPTFSTVGSAMTLTTSQVAQTAVTIPSPGNSSTSKLTIRLASFQTTNTSQTGNFRISSISLTGLNGPILPPSITIGGSTSATATAFTTTYGTASGDQSFTIAGSNLTADISVAAVTGFEYSIDGGSTWGTTRTITQSSGSASATLRVRLAATAAVTGTYNSQSINLSSTGATTRTISTAASGNAVSAKGLTITGLSAANKNWDGNTIVSVTGTVAYSGLVNSESFTPSDVVTWAFPDANVGTNKTLTRTGSYSAPSTNYTVTQPSLTANISAVVPTAPSITSITPGNQELSVAFTDPSSNGGSNITNYEYSTNGGGAWTTPSPAVTSSPFTISGLTNGTTYDIQIRAVNSAGSGTASSTTQGTPAAPSSPTITGAATATAFTTTYGTASTAQNFSISGSALTADIIATAPTGFEVSNDGTTYGSTATFTQSGGSASGTLRIRLTAAAAVTGSYNSQNIVLSSTGASSVNITTAPSGNSVSQKALSITTATVASKVYNRSTNSGTVIPGTLSGFVGSETVVVSSATGTYSDWNVGTGKTATITYILGNGTNGGLAANYSLANTTSAGDITGKSLTITSAAVTSKAYDGTTNATITGSLSGVESGDAVTLTGTGTFASANVGTGINVTSTSTLGGADAGNYTLTQPTGLTGNITAASQTITFNSLSPATISTADYSPGATASSGLTVTYTSSNPCVATITAGGLIHIEGIGTTTITASQSGSGNYAAANSVNQTLTVMNPISTLSAGDVVVIAYNTVGSPDNFALLFNTDVAAGTVFYVNDNELASPSSTSFTDLGEIEASFTVKAGQTIAAGTVIVLPWGAAAVSATQYDWSSTSTAGLGNNNDEIYIYTASSISASTPDAFIGYVKIGTSTSAIPSSLSSGTTAITPSGASLRYATSGATYSGTKATLLTAIGNTATNWNTTGATTFASGDWTFSVSPSPTISSTGTLSAVNTTYGTASASPTSFSVSASNLTTDLSIAAPSGFEISTSSGSGYNTSLTISPNACGSISSTTIYVRLAATTNAGTYSGNIVLSSTGATSVNVATVSSTVSTKTLTISGLTANNKVYDGNTTVSVTGTAAYSGLVNGESFSVSGSVTWAFPDATVGTNKTLTRTGSYSAPSANYTVTQPSLTADITVRSLTITANNVNKPVGAVLTGGSGSTAFNSSGLQNGETIGSVTISYGSGASAGDPVGTYTNQVTPSAATGGTFTASNYSISYVSANIVVSDVPTLNSVTLTSALSTTYGTASTGVSFTASGTNLSANITATAQSGYQVSDDNTTYGSSVSISSGTTIYVRFSATQEAGSYNNATAVVLTSTGATLQNVTTSTSGNTVSQKGLTITGISISNKTYDASTVATISGTAAYSGLVNGESFSVTGSPSAVFNNKNVGTAKPITVSGYTAPSGNYSITQPTGLTADITAKALTITSAAATTKTYDGNTNATISGSLSGVETGDVVTLTGTGTFASANVGTGINVTSTSSLGGADAGNYNLTQPMGLTGEITKANQTITFGALANKTTNDTPFNLTATASSGLTVSYTSSNTSVATIVGNSVTIVGVGTTTITATQSGNSNYNAATDVAQSLTVTLPDIEEIIFPQYIQGVNGTNSNRIPSAFYLKINNLNANTTYRFYCGLVLSTDASTSSGAGNNIFVNYAGGSFTRATGTSMSIAGQYSTLTSDANGSYTGWFIIEPTGNATRYVPGNNLLFRVTLNDGNNGTIAVNYRTSTNTTKVINLVASSGANNGTGLYGASSSGSKNFAVLYDNTAGTGRPISASFIEDDGTANTTANSYSNFYGTNVNGVSGAFGVVIPNDNSNGIKRIEFKKTSDNSLIYSVTDNDGNWNSSANTVNPTGGTTAISIPNSNFDDAYVNESAGVTLSQNTTINGTLTLNSGTLTVGANTLTLNGSISRTSGNIDASNASATVEFGGSTAQTIPASTFTGNINNLTLNNSAGLSINQDVSVSGSLTITNGKLTLGSNHLTLGLNATIGGTPSASNMIIASGDGELRKRFSAANLDAFTFPVGTGTSYTPVVLDFNSGNFGADAYMRVRVKNEKSSFLNSNISTYLNRNWIVEPFDITSPNYSIQLYFNPAATTSGGDFFTSSSLNIGDLKPVKFSSGTWYQPTDGPFTNATPQGTAGVVVSDHLVWNNLMSFSEFGGAGGSNQPLPVELLSFNASCVEDQNVLSWQTASEHNSSHFDIEKSRDGETWNIIGQQTAAGNSTELLNYQFVDTEKNNATVYYRLNQVDVDGKNEYFGPITLACEQNSFEASTLPNPSNGNFWVKIQSNEPSSAVLSIVDVKGNNLFSNEIIVQEGINLYQINSFLDTGIYFIHIYNSKDQKTTILKHLQN